MKRDMKRHMEVDHEDYDKGKKNLKKGRKIAKKQGKSIIPEDVDEVKKDGEDEDAVIEQFLQQIAKALDKLENTSYEIDGDPNPEYDDVYYKIYDMEEALKELEEQQKKEVKDVDVEYEGYKVSMCVSGVKTEFIMKKTYEYQYQYYQ